MKKFMLSLVTVLMAATASYAQSSLVATLSHNGNITTFYGAAALRQAHEAATDGDIINLSSGTFASVDITKGITLRGAGIGIGSNQYNEPTRLIGDFTIARPDDSVGRLTLEGVFCDNMFYTGNQHDVVFLKCRFNNIVRNNEGRLLGSFVQCRLADGLNLNGTDSSVSILNSIVGYLDGSNFELTNCVVGLGVAGSGYKASISPAKNSVFRNCIIISQGFIFQTSCAAYNCVGIADSGDNVFTWIPNNYTDVFLYGIENVFKTASYDYSDLETYELTDEAKAAYKGSDGTEVGIYGGAYPYSAIPTNPQITKCEVADKSTADGKLNVNITVKSAE